MGIAGDRISLYSRQALSALHFTLETLLYIQNVTSFEDDWKIG
jgi:hypothetical protein